ncbi:hypothetical protein AB0I34_42100 [Kribbella sp. NPDC050281]|uniref:hypothetical protein n=1 Tax=Kribbella sp. NPDC050281 TaxID=3155515 RepID=UPI0033ED8E89
MARTRWQDLSPRRRCVIIVGGALEGALKVAALADLARRPAAEVRGSKVWWAVAIALINSVGAVPIAYFVYGRQPRS